MENHVSMILPLFRIDYREKKAIRYQFNLYLNMHCWYALVMFLKKPTLVT